MLYSSRSLLVIHFKYSSVYMVTLFNGVLFFVLEIKLASSPVLIFKPFSPYYTLFSFLTKDDFKV